MGSGKWEVGSGKWEVGSGKWERNNHSRLCAWWIPQGQINKNCIIIVGTGTGELRIGGV